MNRQRIAKAAGAILTFFYLMSAMLTAALSMYNIAIAACVIGGGLALSLVLSKEKKAQRSFKTVLRTDYVNVV